MKKFLFAALAVLMLTAVCIVGMFTVLSQDGTVAAAVDELDAVGAGAVAVTAGACDDGAHDYSVVTPIEEGDYANYYHQSVCSLCGAVAPGVPVPHSFGVWKYDDTAHWLECACGVKQSDIFPTITPVAHDTYIDTDDWHTDGDNHWNECVCGYKANLEAHIGGSATCLEEATCTTCDASYGGVNGGVHVDGGYWEQTETTHQGIYKCCGLVVDVTDHVWGEDHICDICEYECQHTGGEATCVAVAICDWCGKGYGQINPDNHHGGTATCVAEAECTDCGQPYGEKNLENHTSPDFYYEVNGTDATKHDKKHTCCNQVAETVGHTGGTATCNTLAVCEHCGTSYGSYNETNHAEGYTITWTVTVTTHTGDYSCCDAIVAETEHDWNGDSTCDTCEYVCANHVGGTATCKTLAVCDYCDMSYGELDADNHESAEYNYAAIINNDSSTTQHSRTHQCCNAPAENEDHTVGEAANCQSGAICEYCEAEYTAKDMTVHTEATFTYEVIPGEAGALSTQHKKIHTCCGEFVAEDHTGGEAANCQTGSICAYCQTVYTAKDMTVHTEATFRYEVIPGEGGALSTQHKKIHTCCGEFVPEDHTVGEAANCQSGAICEHCEAEYTAKDMTVHTEATFRYEVIPGEGGALSTQHKKIHTCCGEFVPEGHTVGEAANCQSGAICEHCEAEYTAKDMTVHTEATFRYEVIPGEGGAFSTQHKKIHTCCGEFVPEVHTGGVANCQSGARCEYCQEVYTGLNATKHTSTEYTYAPLLNSDNTTTQHTKNYQCCGVVAATESHSGGIANCLEKAVCTNCGTAYGSKDETVHKTPDAFEYAITETQHTKLYACCDAPAAETEDHDFVNGSCSVCDAACAHTDGQFAYTVNADDENQHDKFYQCCGLVVETVSHAFGEDLYNQDSAQHWYLCVCGATNGAEDHAWELKPVANDPDHHHMICTCGNVQADSTAEHTFDAYDKNGTFHWSICACGESAPDAQDIAHVYDLHKHDDENHWSECICGQIDAGSVVAHVLVKDWDEGSHWDSCEDANCNYTANAEEHIYSNLAAGKDAQGHWDECDCGAPNPLSLAEHEWEDGACEICQYTCVHGTADDHEFCVNADDNSKHDEICMLCREVLNTVDHDFTGDVYVSDGEHHWIACADCLVKEDPEAGEAHDTTSEATCNSQAVCSVCGEYGDFDGDNHATEDVKFMPIPGDLKQHAQLHACCDVLIQKMDHTYEDGVCTTEGCEYTCTHTGGTATCKDKAVCTACGEAYGELATEHKYDNACDTKCNVCDAEREITHSYGEWTVTKEATETEAGEKKRTCSICGATQTEEIAALGKQGLGTGAIVGIVAGSVVVVGAGVGIGVAAAKRGAAAKKAAADQKPWRTKKNKKSKWKKK